MTHSLPISASPMCLRRIRSIAASTSSRRARRQHRCRRQDRAAGLLEPHGRRHAGQGAPLELGAGEATDALESLLADAVQRRLVADVPLGAFLSGGIDSSTVAAMMRTRSNAPVRTYSIGFAEKGYDEAPQAKAVARISAPSIPSFTSRREQVEAVIPELPTIYDEPFADSSQVPTYLLSKLTRQHVTVALSGDGGDELFAGYNRHRFARLLTGMPQAVGQSARLRARHGGPRVVGPRVRSACRRATACRIRARRSSRPPPCCAKAGRAPIARWSARGTSQRRW